MTEFEGALVLQPGPVEHVGVHGPPLLVLEELEEPLLLLELLELLLPELEVLLLLDEPDELLELPELLLPELELPLLEPLLLDEPEELLPEEEDVQTLFPSQDIL